MLPRFLARAWLLPLVLLSLAGCTTAVVSLAPPVKLPPALWQCPDQPPPPVDTADDATFFSWVGATIAAGQGCRSALSIAHTAVEGGNAQR